MTRIVVKTGNKLDGKRVIKRAEDLTLNGLINVNIDSPQNLDVLVYHQPTGKWIARPASDIRDLSNVTIDGGFYGDINTTIFDGGTY